MQVTKQTHLCVCLCVSVLWGGLTSTTEKPPELGGLCEACVCVFHVLYLVLLRCGEPGLDEESSLLAVSMREDLLWSGFPADDSGLFTAPRMLADLGWRSTRWREFELDVRYEPTNKTQRWKADIRSEAWLSSPFLEWRMPSSLTGDNFLCCWNSETE